MFLQLACPRFLVPLRVTGGTLVLLLLRSSPLRGTGGSFWRSFGLCPLESLAACGITSTFHVQIVKPMERRMGEHDPERLKAFWKYCEAWKGLAKLQIAGNGAGLAYCIAVLNSASPRYNTGAFIVLFEIGLLLGAMFFFIVIVSSVKAGMTTAIVGRQAPTGGLGDKAQYFLGLVGLWGSSAAFAAAILLFIYRFSIT